MTEFQIELDDIVLSPVLGAEGAADSLVSFGGFDGPDVRFSVLDLYWAVQDFLRTPMSDNYWASDAALSETIRRHALHRAREQFQAMSAHERLHVVESVLEGRKRRSALDELIGMGLDDDA